MTAQPTMADTIMRHEAMPVARRISAPMQTHNVDVSPNEPGISPTNASHKLNGSPVTLCRTGVPPVEVAIWASGVAPETPSTNLAVPPSPRIGSDAMKTESPDIWEG